MKKLPIFSLIGSVYFNLVNILKVSGNPGKHNYAFKKFPELVSVFGCEGNEDAPIAFIDGSFLLRDRKKMITFGIDKIEGKINWYNEGGYLPCLVSEYQKGGIIYKISNFSDLVIIDGNKYDIAFSRVEATNTTEKVQNLPKVCKALTPISEEKLIINPKETVVRDYCVVADRFGKKIKFPDNEQLRSIGGFDEHFDNMKNYWEERLSKLIQIKKLPNEKLINAYKAGYIYTMICKDGYELHVGENGYDRVFDHDVIGMLNTLLLLGDFKDVEEYSKYILKNVQYPDARWKYSWFFALYLQKTGRLDFVKSKFEEIKENAHNIAKSRIDEGKGIMKKTIAIDSLGHWTIDTFSALTGLCCYRYICEKIGKNKEKEWAEKEYDSLLKVSDEKITETIEKYGLDYIPMNMEIPNSETSRSDPRDANRLSMFLFGRWLWDGYLFGANQYGKMVEMIDQTYEHSAEIRKDVSDSFYNFGGYPHGYFCSAYNAGYGSGALRGEKYRDAGIKAYEYMIDYAQSGPFSWWEGVKEPSKKSIWSINHAKGGGGSCPHMWGQSTATKVLIDSLISEKADGTVIIGRGIPQEWLYEGSVIEIENIPIAGGERTDLKIEVFNDKIAVKCSNISKSKISFDISHSLPIEIE